MARNGPRPDIGAFTMKPKSTELEPRQIVRWHDGPRYFGYKLTQLAKKIKEGEIPAPFALSDSGRATGWFGSQIIEWQQRIRSQK